MGCVCSDIRRQRQDRLGAGLCGQHKQASAGEVRANLLITHLSMPTQAAAVTTSTPAGCCPAAAGCRHHSLARLLHFCAQAGAVGVVVTGVGGHRQSRLCRQRARQHLANTRQNRQQGCTHMHSQGAKRNKQQHCELRLGDMLSTRCCGCCSV